MAYILNRNDDTLVSGTSGNDSIDNGGYDENEGMLSGGKNVTIRAGAGSDSISNYYGDYAKIDGGSGNDSIRNGGDNVTITGGAGQDYIYNVGEKILLLGGAGNDSIKNYECRYVTINAGAGNDSVTQYKGKNVSINLGEGNDYIWNGYSESNITVNGGSGNDTMDNSSSQLMVVGCDGNDSISLCGCENITVIGGADNDTIHNYEASKVLFKYGSGDGNDIIYGFRADSTLSIAGNSYSTQESGENIIVTVGDGKISLMGAASLSAVNIVTVSGGNTDGGGDDDTLPAGISVKNGTVTATSKFTGSKIDLADYSANKINASDCDNDLKIIGNAKKNTLRGGSGNDKLTGKGGADLFIFGAGNDTITDYVSGTDKISISGSYTGKVSGSNVILTTDGGTLKILNGANKNLTINGKTKKFSSGGGLPIGLKYNSDKTALIVGNNFTGSKIDLSKYSGVYDVDAHKCKRMNLNIIGNGFNNSLVGGKGSDTINGGSGDDTLKGGAGNDIFKYSKGNDVITDYRSSKDKIKLNNTTVKDIKVDDDDIILTTSTGTLKIVNGAGKSVTIIDKDGKEITQRYSANIAEILADNSIGDFENYTEKISAENLITFAE